MADPLYRSALQTLAQWIEDAREAGEVQPTAMTLATISASGMPSARIVLMKGLDDRGPVFYTNLTSTKGRHLKSNPRAALCFYFSRLERQVRLEGSISQVADDEADAYFASRPRGSQIGARASFQSQPLDSREALEQRVAAVEARFEGQAVPRPEYWSGLRLTPVAIELWQGMASRLHERWRYDDTGSGWSRTLLSP